MLQTEVQCYDSIVEVNKTRIMRVWGFVVIHLNWGPQTLQTEVKGHNSIREVNRTWIIRVWRFVVVCLDWGLQIAEQAWDPSSWIQLFFLVCFELPLISGHVAAGGIVRMHKKCWVWIYVLSVNGVMWAECICLYFILTWTLEEKSVRRFKY